MYQNGNRVGRPSKSTLSETGQVVCLAIAALAASIAVSRIGAEPEVGYGIGIYVYGFRNSRNSVSSSVEDTVVLVATFWTLVNSLRYMVGSFRAPTAVCYQNSAGYIQRGRLF